MERGDTELEAYPRNSGGIPLGALPFFNLWGFFKISYMSGALILIESGAISCKCFMYSGILSSSWGSTLDMGDRNIVQSDSSVSQVHIYLFFVQV